jgi:WD40 repeat protein
VHRDIKPSNVMLDKHGRAKLLDLGLALLGADLHAASDLTADGQVMGTASYMAPEQASDPHRVDVRADLYSLGCTLYFLLTGHTPFDGPQYPTTMKRLLAHSREAVPPIQIERPDVPDELAVVLDRLLAKDPNDRYANAAELAAVLEPLGSSSLSGVLEAPAIVRNVALAPTIAATPGPAIPAARPVRRRWRGVAVAAGLLLLAALVVLEVVIRIRDKNGNEHVLTVAEPASISIEHEPGGVRPSSVSPSRRPNGLRHPVLVPPGAPLSKRALVPRPSPIAGVRSWSVELAGVPGVIMEVSTSPTGDLVATAGVDDPIIRLWNRDGTLHKALLGHEGAVLSVAFSPNGELLASSDQSSAYPKTGAVRIWETASGACLAVLRLHTWYGDVAFSPDGKQLAIPTWPGVAVVDLETGGVTQSPARPRATCAVCWSPDGTTLLSANLDGDLVVLNARTLSPVATVVCPAPKTGLPSNVGRSLGWSNDGKWWLATGETRFRVWDSATRAVKTTVDIEQHGVRGTIRSAVWSNDSRHVLTAITDEESAQGEGEYRVWDAIEGTLLPQPGAAPNGRALCWRGAAWSPDEQEVWTNTPRGLRVFGARTGEVLRASPDRGYAHFDAFGLSGDGRFLAAVASDDLRVFDTASGTLLRQYHVGSVRALVYSPAADLLAVVPAEADVACRVIDAATGQTRIELPGSKGTLAAEWAPDGKAIATTHSDNTIRLWDAATGAVRHALAGPTRRILNVAWSPDGRQLASSSEDMFVRIWDTAAGRLHVAHDGFVRPLSRADPRGYPRKTIAWTADGRGLWVALSGGNTVLLDTATGRTVASENFENAGASNESLAISPDGKRLLLREGYGWTMLRNGADDRRILGWNLGIDHTWLPDGRRFVSFCDWPRRVSGYDAETQAGLGTLFPWITDDHWLCVGPAGQIRGGRCESGNRTQSPNNAISPLLDEQIVYVAMLEDASQITLTPAEFRARFGWKNDPRRVRFLAGPE